MYEPHPPRSAAPERRPSRRPTWRLAADPWAAHAPVQPRLSRLLSVKQGKPNSEEPNYLGRKTDRRAVSACERAAH